MSMYDRHIRRLWLDRFSKNMRDWEAFKRNMNAMVESLKGSKEYSEFLNIKAEWEAMRRMGDALMDALIE